MGTQKQPRAMRLELAALQPEDRFITELRLRLLTPGGHFDTEAGSLAVEPWEALTAAADECSKLLAEKLAPFEIQADEQMAWHVSFETL